MLRCGAFPHVPARSLCSAWLASGANRAFPRGSCSYSQQRQQYTSTLAGSSHPHEDRLELEGAYDPATVERGWYAWWREQGVFEPQARPRAALHGDRPSERFSMLLPPPNVTGKLHIGHALTVALEDTMARWHRMLGREVMWLPGLDHAGIATQMVVEKKLQRERGLTRHDLGREAFVAEVWKWYKQYGHAIDGQLERLGASLDWSRRVFTMDDERSNAVQEAFVRLFDEGHVYRSTRLVHWSPHLRSAISDIEVEYDDIPTPRDIKIPCNKGGSRVVRAGEIDIFVYRVQGQCDEIRVATTRLETMLGDAAIAVHPDDSRYKHLHGCSVVHPMDGRVIPIICDAELADPEVGTGAVKVTPAHDASDYACGKRHGLREDTVIDTSGSMVTSPLTGRFGGLDRFDARSAVRLWLREQGLHIATEAHAMRLARCSRSGDIIEPLLLPQWFVSCKPLAERAMAFVEGGEMDILPAGQRAEWFRWLSGIEDWCVSRQLWWGHRVPAYRAVSASGNEVWVAARSALEARSKAAAMLGSDPVELVRDEDVLDTWFSSGLLPLSALGWPDAQPEHSLAISSDIARFFPQSVLETGHDILFFWVARMAMLCGHFANQAPFSKVYLHAMVRDAHGRKMSKSLGNVIDPVSVIEGCSLEKLLSNLEQSNLPPGELEASRRGVRADFPNGIAECGTDALRMALVAYTRQGRSINLDVSRVVSLRHFSNKMWQAVRFALPFVTGDAAVGLASQLPQEGALHDVDDFRNRAVDMDALVPGSYKLSCAWALHRLYEASRAYNTSMAAFDFSTAASIAQDFFLHSLCDVLIEVLKPLLYGNDPRVREVLGTSFAPEQRFARQTLLQCLDSSLRLLHPMMPFLTEDLWQRLPGARGASIATVAFPTGEELNSLRDEESAAAFDAVLAAGRAARSLKQRAGAPGAKPQTAAVILPSEALRGVLQTQTDVLARLARVNTTEIHASVPDDHVVETAGENGVLVGMHARDLIGSPDGLAALEKRAAKLQQQRDKLASRVGQPAYALRVPADVQTRDRSAIAQLDEDITALQDAVRVARRVL